MGKSKALLLTAVLILFGCSATQTVQSPEDQAAAETAAKLRLSEVLHGRSDESKARDVFRHPRETIEFFGLQPGMRVAEVLPGGNWYTQILASYIGQEGAVYGINYSDDMLPMFGFFTPEMIARAKQSMATFHEKIAEFAGPGMTARGFAFGQIPEDLKGSLDAVLVVRAMHNLNRFEPRAGTRSAALKELNDLLKQGAIVGVVQHRAQEDSDNSWADGSNGYLKQSAVIEMFELAGFEFIASTEINANPKDRPGLKDKVWRLPPSMRSAPEKKAAMLAVGESDRMTLKFRKR